MTHPDSSEPSKTTPLPATEPGTAESGTELATELESGLESGLENGLRFDTYARAWVVARGRVSGLLLALREAELQQDVALPVPLAGGAALRAWAVARSEADTADARDALAVLGHTAHLLGRRLCRLRSTGPGDVITAVLEREADVYGCTPERLVAEVARAHGILTAPDPASAAQMWQAIDDLPHE